MMVGINASGAFSDLFAAASRSFAALKKGERRDYAGAAAEAALSLKENRGRVFLYPKDIPQATIVLATEAPAIHDSGTYALSLMNFILGSGSFNSRLMTEIRVRRGLAYAVQSVMRFRRGTGVFMAYAQTEDASANQVLSLMRENIASMSHVLTGSDLDWAKKSIANRYVFNFDTGFNVLENHLARRYNGLPADYHERYIERIMAVSTKDVLAKSAALLQGGLITVVVGKKDLAAALAPLGEVVILESEE